MRNWLLILLLAAIAIGAALNVAFDFSSDTPCADSACVEEWP